MNRTQAKWLIENWDMIDMVRCLDERNKSMIEAYALGKTVQCSRLHADSTGWEASEDLSFIGPPELYRIKPEPKYVEFELDDLISLVDSQAEIANDRGHSVKATGVAYLRGSTSLVVSYRNGSTLPIGCELILSPSDLLQFWKLPNGKPCGKLATN